MLEIENPRDLPLPLLAGNRSAEYRYQLLSAREEFVRSLDCVIRGRVSLSAGSALRAGGNLTLVLTPNPNIDWQQHRLSIHYDVTWGGEVYSWPLGVFLFESPEISASEATDLADVELLSKLTILDVDCIDQTYSIQAGENYISKITQLIQSTGETQYQLGTSSRKAVASQAWPPGTSKLKIINEMLAAINFWALYVDGWGRFRSGPYVDPTARATAIDFDEFSENAFHLPEFPWSQDVNSVPNKVQVINTGSDNRPAIVGVATNENPSSKYSFQRRGKRWIVQTHTNIDFETEAEGNAIARRKLQAASSPNSTFELKHAPIPVLPNDVIAFRTQRDDPESESLFDTRATFQKIEYTLDSTALCVSSFRGVALT